MQSTRPSTAARRLSLAGCVLALGVAGCAPDGPDDHSLAGPGDLTPAPATAPVSDRGWAGVNANTGFYRDGLYLQQVNSKLTTLGLGLVRMGMDGVYGNTAGAAFTWGTRDAVVNAHLNAGITINAVLAYDEQVSRGSSWTQWQTNWRYYVSGVMAHYKGKIRYYIIGNEPDVGFKGYTPDQMVTFTRIAFEEARRIDPTIRIESPPTTNAASPFLKSMIDLGITRYCDLLGVHSYGGQINDTHGQSIGRPWGWMLASAYPVRPVASSENGFDSRYGGRDWQARGFRLNYIQHKRYGYDHVLLYSIRGGAISFDIASWDGRQLYSQTPTFDAVREAYMRRPFANGGFESPNNRETEWAVYWNVNQTGTPVEWNRANFITNDRPSAHSGTGYLRFDTGESTGGNIVRRVVEDLVPGRSYTLSAWVRVAGGGRATLKALGFNHLNGTQEAAQTTSTVGSWNQLTVRFTPSKTWVVVSLEGTGTGIGGQAMYWDDVTLQ